MSETSAPEAAVAEPPVIMVWGEKVGLGPIRREHVPLYVRWMNDLEVTRTLGLLGQGPYTTEDEEEWYAQARSKRGDASFAIYELASMRPIGNCALHNVNHHHRTAGFGILIGDKGSWDKGYGTEATHLALDYAFNVLGLHNVVLTVYANNRRAIRAYEKAGFKLMGRRREARRLADRVYDELYMDALSTDFKGSVLRATVLGEQAC